MPKNIEPFESVAVSSLIIGFVLLIALGIPIRTALLIGPDEGYETIKAVLVGKGYNLYKDIWNDQPPVYTEILSFVLKATSDSAFAGRLLSIPFGVCLLYCLYDRVRDLSGTLAGLAAMAGGIFLPGVLMLSSSMMLEMPALGLAMLAYTLAAHGFRSCQRTSLMAAGVVLAIALHVKLISWAVFPSIVFEYALCRRNRSVKTVSNTSFIWIFFVIPFLITFLLIAARYYRFEDVSVFYASHLKGQLESRSRANWQLYSDARPWILGHSLVCLLLVAYVFQMIRLRVWSAAPNILFAASLWIFDTLNVPYWRHYDLHNSIGVCLILPSAVVIAVRGYSSMSIFSLWKMDITPWVQCVGLVAFVSWCGVIGGGEYESLGRLSASGRISLMRACGLGSGGRWIFTDDPIIAFWNRDLIPPYLAVMPNKRSVAGMVERHRIIQELESYRVTFVALSIERARFLGIVDYLDANFRGKKSLEDDGICIWLRSQ